MTRPAPTLDVLAAAIEVLRKELHTLRKRCRGCPHSKRVIGFETDVRGGPLSDACMEQSEDD